MIAEGFDTQEEIPFELIVGAISTPVLVLDIDSVITYTNPALNRLLGFATGELIGKTYGFIDGRTDRSQSIVESGKDTGFVFLRQYRGTVIRIKVQVITLGAGFGFLLKGSPDIGTSRAERTAQALKQSEAEFRTLFENSTVGVAQLDVQTGRYFRVNRRMTEITGYSEQELLTMGPESITHPEDWGFEKTSLETVRAGGANHYEMEKRYIRKDGSIVWVDLASNGVLDGDSQVRWTLAVVEDITSRKLAERSLRLSLERERARSAELEAIMESAPAAIWIAEDPECKSVVGNRASYELFGIAPGESIREYMSANLRSLDVALERFSDDMPILRTALSGKVLREVEEELVWKDGRRTSIIGSAAPIFDDANAVRGAVGVFVDVTRTKSAEKELRQSEEKLRLAIEAADIGVWTYYYASDRLEGSSAVKRHLGIPDDKQLDRFSAARRVIEEDRGPLMDTLRQAANMRGEFSIQIRAGLPSQEPNWVAINGRAHRDRIVGVTLDITDQKRSAEYVQALNLMLEQRVKARTAELETAVHDLEGFSYTVSHDLRAPLRAIISTSSIILDDFGEDLNEEVQVLLKRQASSARRMGALIDGLLQFSRLGRRGVTLDTVDLSAVAEDIATDLIRGADFSTPIFHIQPKMEGFADPAMIRLVFQNLMENACKFVEPGHVPVVTVGQQGDTYFVRDQGIGFDAEYAERIFRPFERLHRDDEYPGTGIGLANVARIIHRHGGTVWAEGNVGDGATFYFTIDTNRNSMRD